MSIQHRLYFKSCFICQTNEEGKWGLEPYDFASLVVINPIHRKRFPFPVWEGEFKTSLTHKKKVLHAFLWDKNNNI